MILRFLLFLSYHINIMGFGNALHNNIMVYV